MSLICAALLTIVIETGIFLLDREFRNRKFLIAAVLVNLSTNLPLNLGLRAVPVHCLAEAVFILEFLIWLIEFLQYGVLFGFSWKLLRFTFYANLLSFLCSFI